MSISRTCAAVIPCLNEARTIGPLIANVRAHLPQVIVVDDGSHDETASTAAAHGATVVRHAQNRGKGSALNSGFQRATEMRLDWALAMDGDGQHCAGDIPNFLSCADHTGARMVVGNRMEKARSMPALRRFVNRWMSATLSAYCCFHLPDSQCGFRLVDLHSWAKFDFKAEHFEIESELLLRFITAGLSVQFVPIQTLYAGEPSKIHPLRDTVRWFRWWREIQHELACEPSRSLIFSKSPDISRAPAE